MLKFYPEPLNYLPPRLRGAFAVQDPAVLLDNASRCNIVLVACKQYSLQVSQSSLVQHESQHSRGVSLAPFRRAHTKTDMSTVIPERIGKRMAQTGLREDARTAHQQEYARWDVVWRRAKALLPLPDSTGKAGEVAPHLLQYSLAPRFARRPILLQVSDALIWSDVIWSDKLGFLVHGPHCKWDQLKGKTCE